MSYTRISDLPLALPLDGGDQVAVSQGKVERRIAVAGLAQVPVRPPPEIADSAADFPAYFGEQLDPAAGGLRVLLDATTNARNLLAAPAPRTAPTVVTAADGKPGVLFDGAQNALYSRDIAERLNSTRAFTVTLAADFPSEFFTGSTRRSLWHIQWWNEGNDAANAAQLYFDPATARLGFTVRKTGSADGTVQSLLLAAGTRVIQCRFDLNQPLATRTQYRVGKTAWVSAPAGIADWNNIEWHVFAVGNSASSALQRGAPMTLRRLNVLDRRAGDAEADGIMDIALAQSGGGAYPPTSPAVVRDLAAVRTAKNSRIALFRNGDGDNTAALNKLFALASVNGDETLLGPGDYNTSAEVLIPPGYVNIRGVGHRTAILPQANTYDGVRLRGNFGLNGAAEFGKLRIAGPALNGARPPRNGKAAFVLDNAPQARIRPILAENYDIGQTGVNNSYNATWDCPMTNRGETNVNVGMNLPELDHTGADWLFHDIQVSGYVAGLHVGGDTGGFHFNKFSIGSSVPADPSITVTGYHGDGRVYFGPVMASAPILLGLDYVTRVQRGLGTVAFRNGHVEGWWDRYAFLSFAPVNISVRDVGFNPSKTGANAALGIYAAYGFREAVQEWAKCTISTGELRNDPAFFHDMYDGGVIDERLWATSSGIVVKGQNQGRGWMDSLYRGSNARLWSGQRGVGSYVRNGRQHTYRGRIVTCYDDATGAQKVSADGGATFKTVMPA